SLQATLVFGLLRYYRNDKKPRSPHGTSVVRHDKNSFSKETNLLSKDSFLFKMRLLLNFNYADFVVHFSFDFYRSLFYAYAWRL
ncbi:MAG: hypothetical protein UHC59_06255, partial [Fibrobacteraceae bacterium]|nr:hypothetical protein [Fibrobacteraceae bacterium]